MGASGHIGVYWGIESFSLIETIDGQITNILNIPFDTSLAQDLPEETPDNLKFPTIIKKTLEFRSIKSEFVNLAVPTNDLIFRSFVIPFMEKSEARAVIEFEVTKYIPIKLEDLVYTYHSIPFTEKSQKNLRILFVAIRRLRLENMIDAFNQTGLKLKNIEPAPVCLIHLCRHFHLLQKKQTSAILQIGAESSELLVAENGTLQFVRKLSVSTGQSDLATLQTSLTNETGVSFNFYNRQNPGKKIDVLYILSEQDIPEISDRLEKELRIPISVMKISRFLPLEEYQTISHLSALGATLRKEKFSSRFFDLSEEARELHRSGKDPLEQMKRYSMTIGIFVVCLIFSLVVVIISNKLLTKSKAEAEQIKNKLGPYSSLSISDLKKKKSDLFDKLSSYTKVQTKSYDTTILSEIPKLLPNGVWLQNITITDAQNKRAQKTDLKDGVEIILTGKIYHPNANEEYTILNNLISNIKSDEKINMLFDNVKRDSATRVIENGHTITTFRLTCN